MIKKAIEKKQEIIEAIKWGAFHRIELEEGETMFHYTSIDGLKGLIESRVFRATEYHYLNDEKEFSYVDELLLEIIDENYADEKYYHLLRESVINNQNKYREEESILENSYYVISFSKKRDNLTLWAEFASYGCNIEVEPFQLLDFDNLAYHGYVYYKKDKQKEIISNAMRLILSEFTDVPYDTNKDIKDYLNKLEEEVIILISELLVRISSYYGMAMKEEVYEAEEEYRFIFSAKEKEVSFRIKENLMIPYTEIPLNINCNFDALKSVTLAPLNGTEMCRYAIQKFLNKKCNNRCDIYFSKAKLRY